MRLKQYLNERVSVHKIYFDMDGTLTDFPASFVKIDGRTTQEVEKEGDKAFWEHVDKGGLEFWAKMPWIKGSKKLWNYAKSTKIPLAILTAPARSLPNSPKGKQIWVARELGAIDTIMIRARNKQQYATPNTILIDDMLDNVKRWKAKGGIGIHFKSPEQAIKELKKIMEK
jgi:phosphoglycolate phosphatase-like HAD superfamily hydrolase